MWKDLSEQWKTAFLQGWISFINGSIPIGAVITDESGNIISIGRNKIYETKILNPKIAHAEMDCLNNLNTTLYPNVKKYILYTCMEPCPMCMGTIVMCNIRKLKIAAKDSYCGTAYLCNTDPYIKSKNINVEFILGELQIVQLVLQTYYILKSTNDSENKVITYFAKDSPVSVRIARDLYKDRYLDECVKQKTDFSEVYDKIIDCYNVYLSSNPV